MKKITQWLLIALTLISVLNCSRVPAGTVGIKFHLLGGNKGVDYDVLGSGRYWIGINEELYIFPTFQQNEVWTNSVDEGSPNDESITFQTSEGLAVSANIGVSYHLDKNKIPMIFEKYKRGIDEITDVFLRNIVRDAFVTSASTKAVEYVYGKGKTELLAEVDSLVKLYVDPIGIKIDKIYLIGQMVLPPTVIKALNRKIEATQKAEQRENELREAEAEAKKVIAQADGKAKAILLMADAESQANLKISKSLTSNLVKYKQIEKWNGILPKFSGSMTPLIKMD